ncbi:MAG: hypothetical protein COV91_06255 [Candidatus Taylorbacteria bacterium CG11_big_fil_rev_8_21_14_0_20_46_11]|uniref:Mannosylglycerate hydrolase MGH1-like glycoside hydrolase domain-containing protein n=1 Tax=Candidatus Taylorbacteria bacterium CG11_big_fil_rev_8_21_14_0_20_46_11 TaxID=1975025 RepID=A0A2H0KBS9_9BACT|nr:MAG: hypothetical protein COV91_06255 [Candidatus Taylorbacteria bacterium CG11_big_fil_rev_8_21_14_0_20_46_11]
MLGKPPTMSTHKAESAPTDIQKVIRELYGKNRRQSGEFTYTVPSPDTYPYQWLWDSCFHAIVLRHFDIPHAKAEMHSLLSRQFPNGMVPHMIYWKRGTQINIDWGKGETSSITQPPMIAYVVWSIFEKDGDVTFLESVYHELYHFYHYILNERDPHERHLAGIINPDESGEDNSPRFDGCLNLPPVHTFDENFNKRLSLVEENKKCKFDAPFCMKNFFWVKDVPFNVILAENLRCLANIAGKLDRGYDAEYFNHERDALVQAMRDLMLEDGLFWSTQGEDYRKIKVKTWAIFMPLFAKILSQEEAKVLVETHLKNPKEFWTTYPIPTVSMDEPAFNPKEFWRGPTWSAVNWFIYKGLLNYGFTDEARIIKEKTEELLHLSGTREYFNPLTGEGGGAHNFTWGGLVLDMTS